MRFGCFLLVLCASLVDPVVFKGPVLKNLQTPLADVAGMFFLGPKRSSFLRSLKRALFPDPHGVRLKLFEKNSIIFF